MLRAANPPLVPFHMAVDDGSAVGAPGGRCGPFPMITVSIQSTANARHLGRTSSQQSHCQNAFDQTGAFTDGEFTNAAADGATILGTYDGHLVPTSHPTLFTIQGAFLITGGTGRFVGASGSGLATGSFDAATGAASLELTGHMSSVGSLRRH